MSITDRILNELIALDATTNFIVGGDIDQTISARAFAVELAGGNPFWRKTIDRLFFEGHCRQAWCTEMEALPVGTPLVSKVDSSSGEQP